jgi:hypothetical protein
VVTGCTTWARWIWSTLTTTSDRPKGADLARWNVDRPDVTVALRESTDPEAAYAMSDNCRSGPGARSQQVVGGQ